jgi:hypothetical protein
MARILGLFTHFDETKFERYSMMLCRLAMEMEDVDVLNFFWRFQQIFFRNSLSVQLSVVIDTENRIFS